ATIGERMRIISTEVSGILILAAIISCVFAPMLFKKWMPKVGQELVPLKVALIGMNQTTLGVYKELNKTYFAPILFKKKQDGSDMNGGDTVFNVQGLDQYDRDSLEKAGIFDFDIVVCATSEDELNSQIALTVKNEGVDRVIARVENPNMRQLLRDNDIELYSALESQHLLLRSAIES